MELQVPPVYSSKESYPMVTWFKLLWKWVTDLAIRFVSEGFITGAALSNNATDSTNDVDIAAGIVRDESDSVNLELTSTLTKRIDAAWVVGTNQGGMDTGNVANDTWYYVWLIKRADTGVVDALFSLSATDPTMPANYSFKRLIGVVRRETATNRKFYQDGDWFRWQTPVTVVSSGTATTNSSITLTPAVPPIAKSFSVRANTVFNIGAGQVGSNHCIVQVATAIDYATLGGQYAENEAANAHTYSILFGDTEVPFTGLFSYRNAQSNTNSRSTTIQVLGFKLSR